MNNHSLLSAPVSDLVASSAQKPCPVCGRTKDGDCRIKGDLVLCHNNFDHQNTGRFGAGNIEDYTYLGPTTDGRCGQYVKDVKARGGQSFPDSSFPSPLEVGLELETGKQKKPARPKQTREFIYEAPDGSPVVKVARMDDGAGNKRIYQSRWSDGWVPGKIEQVKEQIHLYRINKARQLSEQTGRPVFLVEGESCVEALLSLGIPATTSIGGAGKWLKYGHQNYISDLEGLTVILAPDCDKPGIDHMNMIAKSLAEKGIFIGGWLYAPPDAPWDCPPENNGLDIADWIEQGATADQILGAVRSDLNLPSSKKISQAACLDETVAEEVKQLREQNNIPHCGLLPAKLRDPLTERARWLNAPPEALELGALVIAASQLPCPVRLVIAPALDYEVPPILNVAFVAESGSGKTPALKTVFKPLKRLQAADDDAYEAKRREYEEQLAKWENRPKNKRGPKPKEPIARGRFFADFTVEALAANLGKNPNFGALLFSDELSGLFDRMNQYRGGKGGDRQFFLELYDGDFIRVDRKDSERISVPKTQVSILGGIQPSIIRKIWREDKSRHDGMWARFCYINFQFAPRPRVPKGPSTKLPQLLEEFYERMGRISTGKDRVWEYHFDDDGIDRWNCWHDEINEMILAEPSEILRASLEKTRERAARLALMVHLAEAALAGAEPDPIVPAATLDKTCQFARWLFGQHRLLCAELGEADSPESAKITRFLQRFEQAGWIDTRQVQRWGHFKSAMETRQFMASLVAGSLAEERQEPKYQIRVANTNQKPRESEPSREEGTEKQLDGLPSRLVPSSLLKTHNGIPPHEFDV